MALKGLIPQSFIQDVLARVEIADVISQYVQLKKAGANFLGLCPFHQENSPSFTVSPVKQFYHCFGCGAHGNAIGFVMEYSGLEFVEAVESLAAHLGLSVPREASTPEVRDAFEAQKSLTELMAIAAKYYYGQLKVVRHAQQYFQSRGVSGEIAKRFLLGFAPNSRAALHAAFPDYTDHGLLVAGLVAEKEGQRYDRFRNRVMFPIRNVRGQVIAFGGRVIGDGQPKYLNSPETPLFNKSEELYGLYEGRNAIRQAGYVLVVEGYMDVVALAQMGFEQAVATLGTAITGSHIKKLLRYSEHIVFAFDGDKAGQKAAWRALEASIEHATETRHFRFLFLPPDDDPDSFIRMQGVAAFESAVAQAWPLSKYLLTTLQKDRDLSIPEARAALVHEAKPLLQKTPAGGLRLQLIRELAQVAQISPAEVEVLCGLVKTQTMSAPKFLPKKYSQGARVGATVVSLMRRILRLILAYPMMLYDLTESQWQVLWLEEGSEVRALVRVWQVVQKQEANDFTQIVALFSQDAVCQDILAELKASWIWTEETAKAELAAALLLLEHKQVKAALDALSADTAQILTADGRALYGQLSAYRLALQEKLARQASDMQSE